MAQPCSVEVRAPTGSHGVPRQPRGNRTLACVSDRQETRTGQACRGCAVGGECLLVDGLIVTVLDTIDRYHGAETNAAGLGMIIRAELAEWHDCLEGRRHLETLLRASAVDGTTSEGLRLLLRRSLRTLHGA